MPEITIDLPWPPSQNSIWRGNGSHVYKSPRYTAWLTEAGWIMKSARKIQIKGYFHTHIILNPPSKRHSDVDNFTKATLDAAQKFGLIENDHLCRRLLVEYGDAKTAPLGLRLTLTPSSSSLPE